MKTKKQIETLLKSYETRKSNLIKKYDLYKNWALYPRIENLTTKIETIKLILNK